MDNDHGITDELREWAKKLTRWWYDHVKNEYTYTMGTMPPSIDAIRLDEHILAIADRIDAEHERLCSRSRSNGYNDGFTDGFNDIESWVVDHEDEMAEHGWVRLPKDADGEVIHLGDLLEITHGFDVTDIGEVTDIHLQEGKCAVSICFEGDSGVTAFPEDYRHYKQPAVEDLLRDMHAKLDEVTALYVGEAIDSDERDSDEARIFAEYAAKLRLAKEGE